MTQFETIAQFSFYVVEFLFQCFKRLKKGTFEGQCRKRMMRVECYHKIVLIEWFEIRSYRKLRYHDD